MSTIKAKQFHFLEDMDIAALALAAVERVEVVTNQMTNIARTWIRRSNDRRQLAVMNVHMLNDIGLTRIDLENEVDKYFWQK
jgi:uncharacterized protein YjiS (DUF1127 family)